MTCCPVKRVRKSQWLRIIKKFKHKIQTREKWVWYYGEFFFRFEQNYKNYPAIIILVGGATRKIVFKNSKYLGGGGDGTSGGGRWR